MLTVRDAQIGDAEGLAHVQVDSYRTAYAGILPDEYLAHFSYGEQTQDWRDLIAAGGKDILLVALNETGEVAGYALCRPGPADIAAYEGELVALHVRRTDQGKRIGTGLIYAIAQRLQDRGCPSLMLWTLEQNTARRLYEKLGGQLIGRRTIELDENLSAVEVAYGWPDITHLLAQTRV